MEGDEVRGNAHDFLLQVFVRNDAYGLLYLPLNDEPSFVRIINKTEVQGLYLHQIRFSFGVFSINPYS